MSKYKKSNKGNNKWNDRGYNNRNNNRQNNRKNESRFKRGQVYYVDLGECVGSEQNGQRPCVILQVDETSKGTSIVVACMTTKDKGRPMSFHVEVSSKNKQNDSYVLCEQLKTVKEEDIQAYIYRLPDYEMEDVSKAINKFLNLSKKGSVGTAKPGPDETGWTYARGEVYNVNLGLNTNTDKIQQCVILQNDAANQKSQTLVVAYMTDTKEVDYKQIRTVDKTRVGEYAYELSNDDLEEASKTINRYLELRW